MKAKKITHELAKKLLVEPNKEYMTWLNDSEITEDELVNEFHLTIYNNGQINVEHNTIDFRIEDVELDIMTATPEQMLHRDIREWMHENDFGPQSLNNLIREDRKSGCKVMNNKQREEVWLFMIR